MKKKRTLMRRLVDDMKVEYREVSSSSFFRYARSKDYFFCEEIPCVIKWTSSTIIVVVDRDRNSISEVKKKESQIFDAVASKLEEKLTKTGVEMVEGEVQMILEN